MEQMGQMKLNHKMLVICKNLIPTNGVYTFHATTGGFIVNCDNEFFFEWTIGENSPSDNVLIFSTDYDTIKRMANCIGNRYGNLTIQFIDKGHQMAYRLCYGRKMKIECVVNHIYEEELVPPAIDSRIPFVVVVREHFRKALEIVLSEKSQTRIYLVPKQLIVRCIGINVAIETDLEEVYNNACLDFHSHAIEQMVRFLGSLHHCRIKLHIHKGLIFRIVAGLSEGFFQTKKSITFYCGHFVSV